MGNHVCPVAVGKFIKGLNDFKMAESILKPIHTLDVLPSQKPMKTLEKLVIWFVLTVHYYLFEFFLTPLGIK